MGRVSSATFGDAVNRMTRQYLETILWAENDESYDRGGNPLDRNYGVLDFDEESVAAAEKELDDLYDFAMYARWAIALGVSWKPLLMDRNAGQVLDDMGQERQLVLEDVEWDSTNLAHDFWLTRNGRHGAGFWDRSEKYGEELSEALTAYSKQAGEKYVYVGDDDRLYIS